MYQSVLMHTDIYEGTEVGDVRDDTWKDHSFFKVIHLVNIRVELKYLNGITGVTTRFLQFFPGDQ